MPKKPGSEKKKKDDRIRVGTALIKQLSTSFYPNPRMVFDELVSNARDAMATLVKIRINDSQITIQDNGEGMDREALIKFFYISHSDKPEAPVKTMGDIKREIIGRFGIGKLSLYQICSWFKIESWKDGTISESTFDFRKFEKNEFIDDFRLDVVSYPTKLEGSGTRITLCGLKQAVSAKLLKKGLMRTMPLADDFQVELTGPGIDGTVTLRSEDLVGEEYKSCTNNYHRNNYIPQVFFDVVVF